MELTILKETPTPNVVGGIFINENKDSLNIRVRDRMEIHVLNVVENIEILEAVV